MIHTIAWCGGTWDLIHPDHIAMFRFMKANFDHVFAAVNTDEFVMEFKHRKTVMCLADRIEVLKAIRWIDQVEVNLGGRDSIPSILASDATHVVTGEDWKPRERYMVQLGIDEKFLKDNKLEIVFAPHEQRIHSTDIRNKLRNS